MEKGVVPAVTKYAHHGAEVFVRADMRGLHREYCLCFRCKKFTPDKKANCNKANLLYALDCALGLTTPVWECPDFEDKIPLRVPRSN